METIIGIDLGTTNSEVALVRDGQPHVFEQDGDPILPSFVGLSEEGRLLVGKAAKNQYVLAPERTIKSIKRKMGEDVKVKLGDQEYRPQEISAMILKALKDRAAQQPRPREHVLRQVDAVLFLKFGDDVAQQQVVEIVAAELCVAVAGEHLDDAFLRLHERDIERAAAEVIDEDAVQMAVLRIVGERGGGRLVEDAHDLQAGQLARFARCLALGVVEVRRHGDDRF